MKKTILLIFSLCLFGQIGWTQVYLDEMDNDDASFVGGATTYSAVEANGELTITGTATGAFDAFTYGIHDVATSMPINVDASGNNKIFVRAKASNVGTQLRMDVQDANGFLTTIDAVTKTLVTDFIILEFDFSGGYSDGGFGGTACDAASAPCPVDPTQAMQLVFYVNPGVGGFNGSVVIDYISFGEEPTPVIMSDVFQDHFEMDSSINAIEAFIPGYSFDLNTANSEMTISGDGTIGAFDPIIYIFRNPNTLDTLDLDVTGNNKLFVKVKTTVPGTTLRLDLQDIDGFITTQGSITKVLTDEFVVYEYDYAGTYFDLGFGGTPCTPATAPCPVDATRIGQLSMFINAGATDGGLLGDVIFDYISFGTSLEPPGATADLVYEDHFNNETIEFTTETPGFTIEEAGTDLTITGDGAAGPFAALSYILHDKTTAEQIFVDMGPGQNKVFVKAKTGMGTVPLRVDLVDTTGFVTSQASITKIISDEYVIFEYNFTASYIDGGFGGSPCTTGPCAVDPTAIRQILIYPDPAVGGYDGTIDIDFVSIGLPLPDDPGLGPVGLANYQDQMDDNTAFFITDPVGLVSTTANDEWTITGDGTGGMWTPIGYDPHNDLGEVILANAQGSGNKLFIRARASVDMTELRVDLQDNQDFVTNLNAQSVILGTEYVVYEIDYTGAYLDGAFGGTPCMTSGCPVDGFRVQNLQFFVNPGVGAYAGTIDIDWISFGGPIVNVPPAGVINYQDEISTTTVTFVEDPAGLVTTTGDEMVITGDGTGGMWTPVVYSMYDGTGAILANSVGSSDRFFIRAKSTVMDTELRIDLQDYLTFVTNLNATSQLLTTEYEVYEYDFTNKYQDGAFGGTPCNTSGCPVDGERIEALHLFVNPGVGQFAGDLNIDWISFGSPITGVQDLEKIQTLRAFPNPTNNVVQIEFDLVNGADVQLNVYNLLGQQMMSKDVGFIPQGINYQALNLAQLSEGMYVVQVVTNGISAGTLRLMKK